MSYTKNFETVYKIISVKTFINSTVYTKIKNKVYLRINILTSKLFSVVFV